jgi:hypothetical protein
VVVHSPTPSIVRIDEEGARGVGQVVLAEEDLPVGPQPILDDLAGPDLRLKPDGHRLHPRPIRPGPSREARLHDAEELDERLLVEADVIDVLDLDAGLLQAVPDRPRWEIGVVLLPGEALLLGCSDELAILHQGRRRVVIEEAQPEYVHGFSST